MEPAKANYKILQEMTVSYRAFIIIQIVLHFVIDINYNSHLPVGIINTLCLQRPWVMQSVLAFDSAMYGQNHSFASC